MFTWNKEADRVLQGIWWLAIVGLIALMIIIGTTVCYVGYYGYKYFKGDVIIEVVNGSVKEIPNN